MQHLVIMNELKLFESIFIHIRNNILNHLYEIYLDCSHAYILNNPCHNVYLFTLLKFPKIGPMFLVCIFSIRSKMKTKNEKIETMTLYA